MSDEKKIEREILMGRKFSLSEGIAQNAKGMFKDVSVVPALTQAQSEISLYIRGHLRDSSGAMVRVLENRLKSNDELLGSHLSDPLNALKIVVERIIENQNRLYDFVREVDQKYGQMCHERPFFQKPGQKAHPDDEYTHESVKEALVKLYQSLNQK